MMKRRGLSIRYKILLFLILVPLITLAAYLILAVGIFKKDKIAYVFDSTLAVAQTLSAQSTTELNGVLSSAKPVMQEFLSKRNFGEVSKVVFDSEDRLAWLVAYRKTANGFERQGLAEKLEGVAERDLQSFGDLTPLWTEVSQKGRLIRVPFKDDRVLIVERVGQGGQEPDHAEEYFMMLSRIPELANSFRSANSEVYLVSETGFVLFGPSDSKVNYLTNRISEDFVRKIREQGRQAGTEEVRGVDGSVLLSSFARVNFGELTVVSLVNREAALMAVNEMVRRSVYFFILLISLSTILSLLGSRRLTSALTDLYGATKKVAEGDFSFRVQLKATDEVGSLAESFNFMASEVSRLMGERSEKARMESELKTAQTVQETLFPPSRAQILEFDISGYYEPASECGGDWWHYCQVEDKIFLWIGDATGHGAPAALITSAAKSASTIIERLNVDPSHAMQLLNRAIYDVSKGRMMMTFFLGCIDLKTHELIYSNASHEGPFLIRKMDRPFTKQDLIPLNEVVNPRLGQSRETRYDQTSVKIYPGDRIMFYTDGLPDIESPEKAAWGEREFLKAIVACNKDYPPIDQAVKGMVRKLADFRQGAPLKDDITFFMVQFTGEAENVGSFSTSDPESEGSVA